ncbi:MAG TPA: hypothetical protein VNX68_18095 [Nitrosopumilaceae archaeon]|jgi:hypothetical protein|nr:hypothetical protein [Nitrosopumilaceae archaeon]
MTIPEPVFISGLGGVSVQMLYLIDGMKAPKDRRPDFRSPLYYLGILCNIALSVILGYVYFDADQKLNKIVYFHIGLSAPLILRTLATTIPEVVRSSSNKNE